MTYQLRREGYKVNHKRVARIMREQSLQCQVKRRWVKTTDSNHGCRIYPNLIKELEVRRQNEVWVADITYIRILTGFLYLAVVLDLFSRKVIGWALSEQIDAQLTLAALRMALEERGSVEGCIHHSDRGVQYACHAYVQELETAKMRISMARKGNPELQAALAGRNVAGTELLAAKAAYLPTLTLDYFYGIDANRFATRSATSAGNIQNLGYAAEATLNIPVWNWGITRSKVRQAQLRAQSAEVQLQFARRKLIADFEGAYQEAEHAAAQAELLRSSVALAADSLRLTTLRYKAGEVTAAEVVGAQNAVAQENNALVDAEAAYANAIAKLQAIAGPF